MYKPMKWIQVDNGLSKNLPPLEKTVVVTTGNDSRRAFFCHRADPRKAVVDDDGWANYTGEVITHYLELPKLRPYMDNDEYDLGHNVSNIAKDELL